MPYIQQEITWQVRPTYTCINRTTKGGNMDAVLEDSWKYLATELPLPVANSP